MSLVGTTSIGFNLFLGGAMAKGKELGSARRGIAFSTASALVVSVLILIVGAGYHNWQPEDGEKGEQFSITQLGSFIKQFVGEEGVVVFAIGFIAAALSSMLTVPLGAALTADSVFSDESLASSTDKQDNPNFGHEERQAEQNSSGKTPDQLESGQQETKQLPKLVYMGIIFIMVIISTVVISANGKFAPTVYRVTRQVESSISLTSIWGVPLVCLGSS